MNLISRIILISFFIFWMAFVFLDYWQKHPVYYFAFKHFEYWGLAAVLLLLGGGVTWAVTRLMGKKKPVRFFNGLAVFGLFLLTCVISVGFSFNKLTVNNSFDLGNAAHLLALLTGTSLAVYGVVAAAYTAGALLNKALKVNVHPPDSMVVDVASGLLALVLFLFLLGAVSMLHSFLLFPAVALLFVFGRKEAFHFLKKTCWQPLLPDKGLNALGIGSFYLLLVLMGLNFASVNVPMPAGFDSLTLYANLPSLIGQHHGLAEGFQPYNWSLLMSLGHILFGSVEISLALSWLGGTLSLWALYALCRNWLRMDVNFTFLALLAFALTPAFYLQASAELKVDLGLLFVYLAILLLLLGYFKKMMENKAGETLAPLEGPPPATGERELVLMGLLSGFAMGIKLTTVYFAMALLCALWLAQHGRRGFFAAFLGSLTLVFLLKIDDFGGLRQYHLGVGNLQSGLLIAALFLLAGIFFQNKKALQNSLRASILYGLFMVLPFLPWMVKNYAESKSLSPQVLMNGVQPAPDINLDILEKNNHE